MADFNDLQTILGLRAEIVGLKKTIEALEAQNQDLKILVVIDDLTKLHNKRAFDERLDEEIKRALRDIGTPLTLVVFDLDHFKAINDTYGHPVGDEVLRSVGKAVKLHARETDFAARVGGEEFALILSSTSIKNAGPLIERLRKDIADIKIEVGGKTIKVTASFGAVEWHKKMDPPRFLKEADCRLYKAKQSGRNRVVSS